jgi:hypothetical protein
MLETLVGFTQRVESHGGALEMGYDVAGVDLEEML